MTWLIGLALGASGIVGFALPWLNMFGPVCGGFFSARGRRAHHRHECRDRLGRC
jgi:hypothetical protein